MAQILEPTTQVCSCGSTRRCWKCAPGMFRVYIENGFAERDIRRELARKPRSVICRLRRCQEEATETGLCVRHEADLQRLVGLQ